MFRNLRGSRWGMLTGLAALALIIATVIVAGSRTSPAAIALGVIATLVGVTAIGLLIAWIVRTDAAMTPRRPPEPRTRRPPESKTTRGPRPRNGRDPRGRR